MRGYLSGELLQHVVGVDLIPFPEVPLCPAFLLLFPAGLALATQLPVRLTHLVLHPPLLLHSTQTAFSQCCQLSSRFFGQVYLKNGRCKKNQKCVQHIDIHISS
jgi:hypothetical protein